LVSYPIADHVSAARVSREIQLLDWGYLLPIAQIRGRKLIAVGLETGSDPTNRVVEHLFTVWYRGSSPPHITRVSDPHVAVVIVAVAVAPLRQGSCRGIDSPSFRTCQSPEHCVRAPDIAARSDIRTLGD
jgi:hypothetical protein